MFLFDCLLYWHSKLQTDITLGITDAELIALSKVLRNLMLLINMVNELIPALEIEHIQSLVKCTAFEDNQSTIAAAKAPSMLPRTTYISLKYHHFRQCVQQRLIDIECVRSENQTADMFTKPLTSSSFLLFRYRLMGS